MSKASETTATDDRLVYQSGKLIIITFPYEKEIVDAVRDIPGRKWDRKSKEWTCPLSSLPELIQHLEPFGFEIRDPLRLQLEAIVEKRRRKAERDAKRKADREGAAKALESHKGPIAFVPAGNATLARRIKAMGAYKEVYDLCGDYSQRIGYQVPEAHLLKILADIGRATDAASRLTELLEYLFEQNLEAKAAKAIMVQHRAISLRQKGATAQRGLPAGRAAKSLRVGMETRPGSATERRGMGVVFRA